MIKVIVSGGQTGTDRAALDVAIELNIAHRGWCPKGRIAEDGIIPEKYHLQETETGDYSERTKLNIRDTEGTIIFVPSTPIKVTDGTMLTIKEVYERKKPHLIIDVSQNKNINNLMEKWVAKNNIKILNVAGSRESQHPSIYEEVKEILRQALIHTNKFSFASTSYSTNESIKNPILK